MNKQITLALVCILLSVSAFAQSLANLQATADRTTVHLSRSEDVSFSAGDFPGLQLITHPLAVANGYCSSTSDFPWEDWISNVQLGTIDNQSGKSPYSDFTNLSTPLTIGTSTNLSLTTSYSYFTWDEYWRVWIDLNQDMDFDDPGELKFEGILSAPPDGTSSKTLSTNLFIAPGTLEGSTRMRVSMSREAFADPCETLDFGEVEDYTVQLVPIPELPDLVLPNNEVIPGGNFLCYTDQGDNFGFFGGVILNSGPAAAGPYEVSIFISEDDQLSADDLEWYNESYDGLDPTGTGNYTDGYAATLDLPAFLTPGYYYFIVKIDPDDAVAEINENNNTFVAYQQVGAADFTVSNTAGVPSLALAGESLNLQVEVTNQSPFPLTESFNQTLSVQVFLSTNDVFEFGVDEMIGETNLPLDQFSNAPFYEGGTAAVEVNAYLPPGLSTGEYYLFVRSGYSCDRQPLNNASEGYPIFIDASGPANEYCTAKGAFPWEDWISKVQIGDFQHTSGKSMYSDFTDQVISLETSSLYSVNLRTSYSYFTWDEYWRIWIDYNQDNDFNDSGELVFSRVLNAPPNGTLSADLLGNFWISSLIAEGTTRMRIRMSRDGFAGPCGDTPFGEVEDYTVQLGESASCVLTPMISNISCDGDYVNFTFQVDAVNGSASGWVGLWPPYSPTGFPTIYMGQYGVPYELTVLKGTANSLTLSISDQGAESCSTSFTIDCPVEPPGQYCESYSEFPWHEWIGQVSLNTLTNSSGKSVYSDFTGQSTSLVKGATYTLDLTTKFSYFTWDEYWRVWIDFNQDNDFDDEGEIIFSEVVPAPINGTPEVSISAPVTIPAGALSGTTRMRVSMQRGGYADPCGVLPFGEVEDYSVQILDSAPSGFLGELDFSAVLEEGRVELRGQFMDFGPERLMGVERSASGEDFVLIEALLSEKEAGDQQYLRTQDSSPEHGANYYRIWLQLENGERIYSPVRRIKFDPPEEFWIYPNPANMEIQVAFDRPVGESDQWMIYDAFGRMVWRKNNNAVFESPARIDVSQFQPGVYYLNIRTEDRPLLSRKFLILRE